MPSGPAVLPKDLDLFFDKLNDYNIAIGDIKYQDAFSWRFQDSQLDVAFGYLAL